MLFNTIYTLPTVPKMRAIKIWIFFKFTIHFIYIIIIYLECYLMFLVQLLKLSK